MEKENVILVKTYDFALRILKLHMFLRKKKVDNGLCSQLLRSGTSIGANTEEAIGAASKKDFIHKMQLAYKEARETRYWLKLLYDGEILERKFAVSFINDCEEIIKILTAILNSSKSVSNS